MKKLVILGLLIVSSSSMQCQIPSLLYPKKIDSLLLQLKTAEGTEKVDVLNGLALHLAPLYFDSSLNYANEALQLAEKINYVKGKGIATFNIGNCYYFTMDVKNALVKYFDALRLMEDLEPSQELGDLYCQIGEFSSKLNNYKKALNIFKIIRSKTSETYVQLKIQKYPGNYDSTYFRCKENLENFRKTNNLDGIYETLIDLANACFYIGRIEGLLYAEQALQIVENEKDLWLMANAYHKIVNYYENANDAPEYKSNYKLAEYYLLEVLELLNKSNQLYQYELVAETYRELGYLRLVQKDYKTADDYFKKGIVINIIFLKAFDTLLFPEPDQKYYYWGMGYGNMEMFYHYLKLLNLETGNFKEAYKYLNLGDSIENRKRLNMSALESTIMQANYEDERSRHQIELLITEKELSKLRLNHSRVLFIGIGGAMLFSFLIILLWFQRKRFKSDQKALILEQKLLRSQMNPHFLFNSLTSIQNFIVAEKPDKASVYLSKFSKLVRNILDNSIEEYVSLEREISTIENYIELQKVRYAGKFDYRIKIDPGIDDESFMIPPMLAQPFIENAIEHGVKHRETPGHIDIRFTRKDHSVIFEVEDNGVGREKAKEFESLSSEGHRSMATSITRERLTALNKKLQRKITLDITDLKNESNEATGTLVTFGLPI